MHARAASKLVDVTKGFASDIKLIKDSNEVDGKSIMSLLLLGASVGSQLKLSINGDDEDDAFDAVCALVEAGFHELDEN